MSSNRELISDVSDTSYWVAYYRAKETDRPDAIFKDPLAKTLIGEHGKNIALSMPKAARMTEWVVVSRTVIIDRFIASLVAQGVDTVINLGAGLDTRPYRMSLPSDLNWIEVDFPKIIEHKEKLLVNENIKCKLVRKKMDLSNRQLRQEFFKDVGLNSKKVLVITEGVIPYLSPEQVEDLGSDLFVIPSFQFWITEYFDKSAYRFLRLSVQNSRMKNAPFLFFPEDWLSFFHRLGWKTHRIEYFAEISKEFSRIPPVSILSRLMYRLLPTKIKTQLSRMSGYLLFEKV